MKRCLSSCYLLLLSGSVQATEYLFGPITLSSPTELKLDLPEEIRLLGTVSTALKRASDTAPQIEREMAEQCLPYLRMGIPVAPAPLTADQRLTSQVHLGTRKTLGAAHLITGWSEALLRARARALGRSLEPAAGRLSDRIGIPPWINVSPVTGLGDLVPIVGGQTSHGTEIPQAPQWNGGSLKKMVADPKTPTGIRSVIERYLESCPDLTPEQHPTALYELAIWLDINVHAGRNFVRQIRKLVRTDPRDTQARMHFEESPKDDSYIEPMSYLGTIRIDMGEPSNLLGIEPLRPPGSSNNRRLLE